MKTLITEIMPEDSCSGDVAGGSALVPGMSLGILFLKGGIVMAKTHQKTFYRRAVVNFVNGECPPGKRAGEFYDPDVEDLETHCGKNCDVSKCFGSWLETQGE